MACRGGASRVETMRREREAYIERLQRDRRIRDETELRRRYIFPFREYVYVARSPFDGDAPIKIGYSCASVKRRIKAQRLQLLFVINTDEGRKVEKALHHLFDKQRLPCSEYFCINGSDLERIRMLTEIDGVTVKVVTHDIHLQVYLS